MRQALPVRSIDMQENGPWLHGQPHGVHAEAAPNGDDFAQYNRVQMEVLVHVDMIERKPAAAIGFELCSNFRP